MTSKVKVEDIATSNEWTASQVLTKGWTWVDNGWQAGATTSFWDGSDGDVTISGTVTLVRDMYYNNLIIPAGQILNPAWYKIFVKWSLTGAGKIQRNGNPGTSANGQTQWTWGAALSSGTLGAEIGWKDGWVGWGVGAGWAWWAGTATNPSYVNITWAAWWAGWGWGQWWGIGWWTAWGIWWVSTRWANYNVDYRTEKLLLLLSSPTTSTSVVSPAGIYLGIGWSGGGSGWSSSPTLWNAWWGGWSGWNGWLIRIKANTINRTGIFESIWGNGWDWSYWTNSSNWWWGGWGWWAGGSGWVVVLVYATLTSLWSTVLTWWTGGIGWPWWDRAPAGWTWVVGGTGNAGVLIQITI
jgi:hypothetical protein